MSGLQGHLDLLAARDPAGRTVLRRQSCAPPIHISKPHHDQGWLVVNLASPSPGLLEGDRVRARVALERGARLLLTAPSANRVHATPTGSAELAQEFTVEPGAFLDVWPEYLIPQAGARYRQRTTLRIAEGGTLLWTETLAPGRVARGEAFAFTEVALATDLHIGERHVIRERYQLTPGRVTGLRAVFPNAYYASILCVSPALANAPETLRAFTEERGRGDAWIGGTEVAPGVWALKIVAPDSPTLRIEVAAARSALYRAMGETPADLRRVTGSPA